MEKAAALLAESGVADQLDGKVITVDENPVRVAQALALQDAAAQLGHQLEIEKHHLHGAHLALLQWCA